MNIYIYSDESGVFDQTHNDIFVFGGLIFLSKSERDIATRKYIAAERCIAPNYNQKQELKACVLSNKDKGKLYRSLNSYFKFGVVIEQSKVLSSIFFNKKSKQRFLDYAYKIAVKRHLERLILQDIINPSEVENMNFFVDEHTTATNGKYELKEGLLEEFKFGTYNWNYSKMFPPIFRDLKGLNLEFCDSKQKPLVRAADIVANKLYHKAVSENRYPFRDSKTNIIKLP